MPRTTNNSKLKGVIGPSMEGGPISKADARVINDEFQKIRERHGELTAELVGRYGQDPASPLYRYFAHDIKTIRRAYIVERARWLIRHVSIIFVRDGHTYPATRAWIHVRTTKQYMPAKEVMENTSLRELHLQEAAQDLESWKRRYQSLLQVSDAFRSVERAIQIIRQALHRPRRVARRRRTKTPSPVSLRGRVRRARAA